MENIKKKKPLWVKIILVVLIVTVVNIAVFTGVSIYIYESVFGVRFETYAPLGYNVEDFEGLQRAEYTFYSNKGQALAGYLYHNGEGSPKGVIITAHGFCGGGHNSYMDCINYFAQNGYYVFTYDITGNDNSEGDSVGGLPQGLIDLSYAIDFVKDRREFDYLPIMLFGHSWGGYSVTNVLNYHPDIKAVVSFAGFDTSIDLIKAQGENIVGEFFMNLALPILELYEGFKFGEYAESTALEGFEKSEASVMVFHSVDDTTVPKKYGYDIWYEKYKDNPRFKFIPYEDRGHSELYYSDEAREYIKTFNEGFDEWAGALPEDMEEEEFTEKREKYIVEKLDREKWCNLLDMELFGEILEFYNSNLK